MRNAVFRSVLSLAALSAGLAACAVGPNYVRPSAPLSPTFKEAQGWAPAAPADALDRGPWWTLFADPTLTALEQKVQVSNQNIIAAEAAYRQARAVVREDQAGLFPTLTLNGSGTTSGGGTGSKGAIVSGGGGTVVSSGGGQTTQYRASIGGTWEPDVWGRIRRTIEGAKATAAASEATLAAARLSAQGELATDYFGLREADTEIAIAAATVDAYQKAMTIATNRFNAGVAPRSDVLQAQTQLANAQADLAGLNQQRADFEHAIAVLTGEAPGNFSLAAEAGWTGTAPDLPPGLPSTLLQRRPDIAEAERRVAAANAQIGVQVSAYFPTLTLTGSYGYSARELSSLFSSSNNLWSYGLTLAETLFDAGARRARVNEAKATHDQSVAQYRQTVLSALQNVEDELAASKVLAQQASLRQQAADAAGGAEQMVLNRYKAGQVAYSDVITAQTAAYTARRSLAQSAAQRQTTAVALIQSLGGGWKAS
jgi:NodT family efflux transporter outer membrane factor (OMF) lipoprotein